MQDELKLYEKLHQFAVGLSAGLYSLETFSGFLDDEILAFDTVPDICLSVWLAVPHGTASVVSCIYDGLSVCGYEMKDPDGCPVQRAILGDIRSKYLEQKLTLKEACEMLQRVSVHFDPYSEMNALADYYTLAEQGVFYTLEQVQDRLDKLLNIE